MAVRGDLYTDEVGELELVMAQGWPAPHTGRLGSWLLRAGGGFTSRANSVLCVGDPGCDLDEAQTRVRDWYAAHALPTMWALPTDRAGLPLAEPLADRLARQGLRAHSPTVTMTRPAAGPADRPPRRPVLVTAMPAWLAAFGRYRPIGAHQHALARSILTGSPEQRFLAIEGEAGTGLLAAARVSLHEHWAGLHAMWVDAQWRRRGLATDLLATLGQLAEAHGADRLYLQVERENTGAIAAYDRSGFVAHHGHVYYAE